MSRTFINLKFTFAIYILAISTASAQYPNWLWSKNYGGSSIDNSSSIVIDKNENLYVTGVFASQTIVFGVDTLINKDTINGSFDIFVAKYDASGNILWAKSAGSTGNEDSWDICVDLNGNIYITGSFNDPMIFGTDTLANYYVNSSHFYIAKYDSLGNELWARTTVGYTTIALGTCICVDINCNTYVSGVFAGPSITFDTLTLIGTGNDNNIFVVKYDSSGNVLWANCASGTSDDLVEDITVDSFGNSYLVGNFQSSTISFDSISLTNNGNYDLFIAKYDALGNILWVKNEGNVDSESCSSICIDLNGNIYLTGSFSSSTLNFGITTLSNFGGADLFIAKYDNFGNVIWANGFGGISNDFSTNISIDTVGGIYITGQFYSPIIIFGSTTLTNFGIGDYFIVKINDTGDVVWAKSIEINSTSGGIYNCVNNNGNVYVVGNFSMPSISFDNTTLVNNGGDDFFVAKLDNITGFDQQDMLGNLLIFPNPIKNILVIEGIQNSIIEIINIHGQIRKILNTQNYRTSIDLSELSSGVYTMKIKSRNRIINRKIIKQ